MRTYYNDCNDKTRETFMNRTLENAEVRERIIRSVKKLDIEPRTAQR